MSDRCPVCQDASPEDFQRMHLRLADLHKFKLNGLKYHTVKWRFNQSLPPFMSIDYVPYLALCRFRSKVIYVANTLSRCKLMDETMRLINISLLRFHLRFKK